MASILSIATDVADDIKLVRPATLFVSDPEGDQTARDLLRAMHRVCRHLGSMLTWPALTREKTFTSGSNGAQTGALPTGTPRMLRILPQTMFDRTNAVRVLGPLSSTEWQERQALQSTVSRPAFMMRGGALYLSSPSPAGATIAFEYTVESVGTASDGATYRGASFTADTDLTHWSDELVHLGMVWAMLHRDGMVENVDYEAFWARAKDEITQAAIGDVLSLSTSAHEMTGPYLPESSWSIT